MNWDHFTTDCEVVLIAFAVFGLIWQIVSLIIKMIMNKDNNQKEIRIKELEFQKERIKYEKVNNVI